MALRRCPLVDVGERRPAITPSLKLGMMPRRSILLGERDRENAPSDGGIGRVRRAVLQLAVVVVDLPIDDATVVLEAAEIVFHVRIVILRKVAEAANALQNCGLCLCGQRSDADRDEGPTAGFRYGEGGLSMRECLVGDAARSGKWARISHSDFLGVTNQRYEGLLDRLMNLTPHILNATLSGIMPSRFSADRRKLNHVFLPWARSKKRPGQV